MFNRKVLEEIKYELTKINEEQKIHLIRNNELNEKIDKLQYTIDYIFNSLNSKFDSYSARVTAQYNDISSALKERKVNEDMIESNGLLTRKVNALKNIPLVFKPETEKAPGLIQRNKYGTFDKEALLNKVSVYLQTNKTAKKRTNIISDLSLTKREVQNLNNVLLLGVKRVLIKKLRMGVYKATNVYKIN